MSGIDEIAAERATHEARGYTAAVDDQWHDNELALAAVCYASPFIAAMHNLWPWDSQPSLPVFNVEQRIKQLAKAGALIAAEIDRLERFAESKSFNRGDANKSDMTTGRYRVIVVDDNGPAAEQPQEYILIEPGQEPSGDEPLHNMHPDSAKALSYLLKETGDKRRWLPSADVLGSAD